MKRYAVKYRPVRDHGQTRCVNPHCGKWVELYREKTCPGCGKRFTARADKQRCDECHTMLEDGDAVCPLCGSKQRTVVELRGLSDGNLTAFSHLLHEALPGISLAECRKQCRSITMENPYRLPFDGRPEKIRNFVRRWNALGGTAAACLGRETSRRPVVLLRSYNRLHEAEHARLLFEAVRKSEHPSLTFAETMQILHSINRAENPIRLCFATGFDGISAWVNAWRKLGGTAVRSGEHREAGCVRDDPRHTQDGFALFFP